MKLTINEIKKIEGDNLTNHKFDYQLNKQPNYLTTKELINHPSFSHAVDETNEISGAVCSIYFLCSETPTGVLFVSVRQLKDLPYNIKPLQSHYCKEYKNLLNKYKNNIGEKNGF